LRESGLIDSARLGLPSTDKETVKAALLKLRDRLLGKAHADSRHNLGEAALVDAVEAGWEDDTEEEPADGSDEDIPF
jgi:hypothetical protein